MKCFLTLVQLPLILYHIKAQFIFIINICNKGNYQLYLRNASQSTSLWTTLLYIMSKHTHNLALSSWSLGRFCTENYIAQCFQHHPRLYFKWSCCISSLTLYTQMQNPGITRLSHAQSSWTFQVIEEIHHLCNFIIGFPFHWTFDFWNSSLFVCTNGSSN